MIMTLHSTRGARAVAALVLGALGLLGGAVARPASAVASGDAAGAARWTVAPADNRFGADRKNFGLTLGPGGRQEDGIVIANQGDTTLRLALRAADAVTTSTGRLGLVARGGGAGSARPAGLAAWVRLSRDVVTVAPGAQVTVPFTIAPPKGAAAGDHVGGIVTAPEGSEVDRGVPIRLRVSGPLRPALAVSDVHVDYSGTASPLGTGDATVSYTIRNTGNATLTARQTVKASGPFGAWSRRAARIADTPALPPGGSWKVSVPLRDVAPALRLKATVALTPLLVDAAGSIAPLPAVEGTGHTLAVPWSLLVVLVVVGGVAVVALRRARRRRVDVGARARVDGAVA
jgi:Bacterial protein of unknown function (DUF916)